MSGLCQINSSALVVVEEKVDRIYVLCRPPHFSVIFFMSIMSKCDYRAPIVHVPWLDVCHESVTQQQARSFNEEGSSLTRDVMLKRTTGST